MTPVDHLIEQYWAGKATASEKEQLYRYVLVLHPEASFDDFESFLDNVNPEHTESAIIDGHAQYLLYSIKLRADIRTPAIGRKRNFRKAGFAIAACVLITGFLCLPWLMQRSNISQKDPGQFTRASGMRVPVSKYICNNSNTLLDTLLPDNSSVTLFPNSSIAFVEGFELHARRLSMWGRVRFHVAKDKTRAFQVWAGGLVTTAIGTVFEISTLNRNQTDIKLIEGKISVKRTAQSNADSVVLHAGESLVYLIQQNKITRSNSDAAESTMSAKAELVFNDLPLALVFKQLEAEYGIVVEYEAPATDVRFSARFQKNIGPDKIISTIVQQNKLTMEHNGGVYTIK